MITESINQLIADALKSRDELRLLTLRLLSSALNYEKIAKQHDLSEDEEMIIVRREVSKRRDAIEAYEKAGADDRAEKEKKELEILRGFLPPEISNEDLERVVEESINALSAQSLSEAGKVIGLVVSKVKGAADGKRISEFVRAKLQ